MNRRLNFQKPLVDLMINEHSPCRSARQSPTSFESLMGLIQVLLHVKVISQSAEGILAVDSMPLVRFKKLSGLYKVAASGSVTGSSSLLCWKLTPLVPSLAFRMPSLN